MQADKQITGIDMNEKHIQYVLTIVQEGSFTAASKKLYVTQPSLSQTIKLMFKAICSEIPKRILKGAKLLVMEK